MTLSPSPRRLRAAVSLLLAAVMLSAMMVGQAFARPIDAETEAAVGSAAVVPQVLVDVYRFYNPRTGTHFYTADAGEKNSVLANLAGVYSYEGVAYTLDTTAEAMNLPLYRFFNTKTGTHFYTLSAEERDYVGSHYPQFNFEGTAYYVSGSPVDSTPVYRFYNGRTGAHFYTAGESERATIQQSLPVFGFEGPAFYLAAGDYVEPTIEITGVTDGGVYKAPAIPVVTVGGATSQTVTLNGEPFTSGAEVTALGAYTLAVSASDAAGNTATQSIDFTVVDPKPVISAVSISSNSPKGSSVAANGDIITLTFTTDEPVTKLSNFKINSSNPDTFTNVGNVYTATHLVDAGDPITGVPATFQINVQNEKGIYSQTIEVTNDASSVTIVDEKPVISAVSISSNSPKGSSVAANGDIITLTFTTDEPVTKLSNFKINSSNPDTFTNVGNVYTATHLVDVGDPITGVPATFQINVQNDKGIYSQTIEVTNDASSVTIVGAAIVTNQAELEAALADSTISYITFGNSFTTNAQITASRPVVIDGAGFTLSVSADLGTVNGSKHAFAAQGAAVTLSNLTIDSASLAYGVNTYDAAVLTLQNVSLLNSKGAGLTVNGSGVTASALSTSGNAWGAVNVDPGTGVLTPSNFVLNSGTLAEAYQIWSDKAATDPTVTVTATSYTSLVTPTNVTVWSNRSYTVTATAGANGAIAPATTTVPFGSDVSITITPDAGYYLSELTVDGTPVAPQSPFEIADIYADHAVVATFATLSPAWTADAAPVLADVATPGAWIKDRYAPAGFESVDFGGHNVLKLSLAAADFQANDWYNTMGRKYQLSNAQVVSTDVYLPAEWATGSHRVGMWATAVDGVGAATGWPIVDFYTDGTTPVFRVWDNFGWHNVTTPVAYGQWYNFRIQRNADSVTYYINGALVYESSFADDTDMAASTGFSEIILQSKNFNADDAVYFDNVVPVPNP